MSKTILGTIGAGGATVTPHEISALTPAYTNVAEGMNNNLYGYNPKRYSGKILRKFYETCVLAKISNTDYEGEIKDFGDTVIIRTTPDIKVYDYKKGQNLEYKVYDTDTVELTIDKGKYWAFVTNPIDKKQTDIKSFVENWTSDAAKRISIAIEEDVYRELVVSADSHNCGTSAGAVSASYNLGSAASPVAVNAANAIQKINDCGSVMGEQNLPTDTEAFWMVIDQKYANILAGSELRLAWAMGDGKSQELKGGQNAIPHLDCFDIFRSNILPKVAMYDEDGDATGATYRYVVFGHKAALTFAAQLTENEALPNPFGFGTLHRGLTVYGFKVVQPKCLGVMVVQYADSPVVVVPLTLSAYTAAATVGGSAVTVTATNVASGGTLAATSSNTAKATVAVAGSTITITPVAEGTCSVFVTDGTTPREIKVTVAAAS